MGKTLKDRPAKKYDNQQKRVARGEHRKMDPYSRACEKQSYIRDINIV